MPRSHEQGSVADAHGRRTGTMRTSETAFLLSSSVTSKGARGRRCLGCWSRKVLPSSDRSKLNSRTPPPARVWNRSSGSLEFGDLHARSHRTLSLLLSNLSSTSSKASGPSRTVPEKGYSREPMVKSTSPITRANAATISVWVVLLSSPKR
jgi:hypothetical protein